jgi:hypothetical protein
MVIIIKFFLYCWSIVEILVVCRYSASAGCWEMTYVIVVLLISCSFSMMLMWLFVFVFVFVVLYYFIIYCMLYIFLFFIFVFCSYILVAIFDRRLVGCFFDVVFSLLLLLLYMDAYVECGSFLTSALHLVV